ncbi:hypothetical protein BH18VER1_BH18VER1_08730 [soil metagenome]
MKVLVAVVLAIVPVTLFAAAGLPDRPYIYVEGKGEIVRPAEIVTLRFELIARNPDQAKANAEVQDEARRIFSLFNERKVAQDDVIASDLRSETEYEGEDEPGDKRGKLIGYTVTRPFAAKIRDLPAFPKLVDELLGVAGVQFKGIDGGLSKEKEVQDEVWDQAIANARERAEKTLKTTRMKIDSIFALSPVRYPEILDGIFQSRNLQAMTAEQVAPDPAQYRLAPVTVTQSVHVIYLISPAP